jgi:hypothetical protein
MMGRACQNSAPLSGFVRSRQIRDFTAEEVAQIAFDLPFRGAMLQLPYYDYSESDLATI